jgi:hypothetical protein
MTKPIKRYYGTNEEHYCALCGNYQPSHGEQANARFKAMQSVIDACMECDFELPAGIMKALNKLNALTKGKS